MGIKPNFTAADFEKRFNKFLSVVEKRQIERLQMLGELCVAHAREIPAEIGFGDVTGNLRSSIGYVVFKNGIAIHDNYTGTSEGIVAGKSVALREGAKFNQGISLVVTAGMNYAQHVESRGKDVLTSAELFAKQELPNMLAELKQNISKSLK